MSSSNLKKAIGKAIPYPVIQGGRKVIHFGLNRCRVCNSQVRRLRDTGYGYEVLERLQVVGGLRRFADQCPICHSSSRERLVWYWLTQAGKGFRFSEAARIAHFAPEKGLSKAIRKAAPANYQAYDFEPARYRHLRDVRQADLTSLSIPCGDVDLLICNHVIEHVIDVEKAMRELFRVLSPGGVAIIQVPIAMKLDETIDLAPDSTHEERIRLLGQDDHLRLFNQAGFVEALQAPGFAVELFDPFESDSSAALDWMLDPFERLHICRKPKGTNEAT